MNFLAHAYLSFGDEHILVGNMISDFVKGKKKFDLPEAVQKGITLHRLIDEFTDDHPINKTAREFFRPAYRLYAGAFVDVLYDHLLANDRNQFPTEKNLKLFSATVYTDLNRHFKILPSRFQQMLPFMQSQDWLYNYRTESGLQNSLEGLRRRALYIHESATALDVFKTNKTALLQCFNLFFPELKFFAERELRNLLAS